MKVLVFSYEFANPTLTFVHNEIMGLSKYGQVKVLTCKRLNADLFPYDDVVEIPFETNSTIAKLKYKLRSNNLYPGFISRSFAVKAQQLIDEYKPDIIHAHFGFDALTLLLNVNVRDIPTFISFHGFDASHKLNSVFYRLLIKWVLRKRDVYPLFVSHYMRRYMEQKIGVLKNDQILYCGVDIDFFKNNHKGKVDKREYIFLQVASFTEKKGQIYTIQAFEKLVTEHPDLKCKLILAGGGNMLEECKSIVENLNLQNRVEFPGVVDRVLAQAYMQQADCFLHHSVTSEIGDTEGIPTAIMEAMAMELPIISTIHAGIPELVENGRNGYLVPEKDILAYSLAMSNILQWELQPQNRQKVGQLFEKEQHAQQLLAYYHESLQYS